MNDYGTLQCQGTENGITYEVFLNNDFRYTIIVSKGSIKNIKYHYGVRSIFGLDTIDVNDAIDVNMVNEILDKMIKEVDICSK